MSQARNTNLNIKVKTVIFIFIRLSALNTNKTYCFYLKLVINKIAFVFD